MTLDGVTLTEVNRFPKRQVLDAFEPREFADDFFKFDENARSSPNG